MIDHNNFITLTLNSPEVDRIKANTWITYNQMLRGEISGYSRIYGANSKERNEKYLQQASTGQASTLALNIFLFGLEEGLKNYQLTRDEANANPTKGDHGSDAPGYQVDIKSSSIPYFKDMLSYHLVVRPRERHKDVGQIYVHALVRYTDDYNNPRNEKTDEMIKVHITGWAYDTDLPDYVIWHDKGYLKSFKGAHIIPVPELRDIRDFPLKAHWLENDVEELELVDDPDDTLALFNRIW